MRQEQTDQRPRFTVDYTSLLEKVDGLPIVFSRKWVFRSMLGALIGGGAFMGYRLACLALLKPYKLVNVIGGILTLLGIAVLSELLASPVWKALCVKFLAPLVMWVLVTLPVGMVIGSIVGAILHKPSSQTVFAFAVCFFGYAGVASAPFGELVVSPRFIPVGLEYRWKWMGFLLLLGGAVCQLAAAFADLTS